MLFSVLNAHTVNQNCTKYRNSYLFTSNTKMYQQSDRRNDVAFGFFEDSSLFRVVYTVLRLNYKQILIISFVLKLLKWMGRFGAFESSLVVNDMSTSGGLWLDKKICSF